MLGFFFGFNARLGRLHYFLASLVLVVAFILLAVVLAVALAAVPNKSSVAMSWLIVVMVALFLWSNTMLQAMRFRDIGWDPVCVIPAWIAVMILDYVIALRFPDYAVTSLHSGTIAGGLINLGLCITLLFFPSGADEGSSFGGTTVDRTPAASARSARSPASASEARLARITGRNDDRRDY